MKKLLFYIAFAAMISAFAGCSPEPNEGNDGEQGPHTFVLSADALTFPQEGGSATISVEPSSAKVVWTIENSEDYEWCHVSVNDNDVTFTAEENPETDDRTAEYTFSCTGFSATLTVTQSKTDVLNVTKESFTIGAEGGELEIEVSTNIEYNVTIPEAAQEWITLVETRALRSESVVLHIDANASTEERTAVVELTDMDGKSYRSITITQEAVAANYDFTELCTDTIFRDYVFSHFDTDNDGELSAAELGAVTEIDVNTMKITSLSGIQCFPNLTTLICSYNRDLTELDVSKNTKLAVLDCDSDSLTTLDVSKNTKLTKLKCTYNKLPSLDVSKNTELLELWCGYTNVTSLDVSNNHKLTRLYCTYSQQLASLNVSGCTELNRLECENCLLTTLDVSGCVGLKTFSCYGNKLTSLNASGCVNMTDLRCESNSLTDINLSGCAKLDRLHCFSNKLTTLDISDCTVLTNFHCYSNKLTTLNLSGCANITDLRCYSNELTALDISACTKIKILYCNNNLFTELDLSSCCDSLTELQCNSNKLTALDLSGCTNIKDVRCQTNKLTTLDLSSCTKLEKLFCNDNELVELDVSMTNLGYTSTAYTLKCAPMKTLKTLTLKTGWNIKGINVSKSTNYIPSTTTIKYVD